MSDFYATYSASAASSSTVTALQGTTPWVVTGDGVAGTPSAGVLTVQGDPSGTAIPITGSISATNPSVSATGAAVPADATFVGGSDGTNLVAVKVSAAGVVSVDGSGSTQPISGTVTANQGGTWNLNDISGTISLPTGAATEATLSAVSTKLTDASQKTQVVSSGGNTVGVRQLNDQVVAADYGIITNSVIHGLSSGGGGGYVDCKVTPSGALVTDGTATVSGTVAATQSGTWTVQPGNTANTTAWLVTQDTTTAAFQAEGNIAFGSLTASYQTVFTPAAGTKILQMRNNTNAAVSVSFDAGTTTNYILDAGDQVSLDLRSNLLLMSTTAIQAKYTSGAPTSGSFRVNGGG